MADGVYSANLPHAGEDFLTWRCAKSGLGGQLLRLMRLLKSLNVSPCLREADDATVLDAGIR